MKKIARLLSFMTLFFLILSAPAFAAKKLTLDIEGQDTVSIDGDDGGFSNIVPGCGTSTTTSYDTGFNATHFDFNNVNITTDGYLELQTGNDAIKPEKIIIPYEQEVAVNFLYEGAGYTQTDFGWLLVNADGSKGAATELYQNINDNNNDGILDDRSSLSDNRESLGIIAAGTEIAFYLKVDDEGKIYYTKTEWNPDTYAGGCDPNNGGVFTKTYYLGRPLASEGNCVVESNWMPQTALDRLAANFDLEFDYNDKSTLEITPEKKFPHVMVGAPGNKPNEWILGWEDLYRGGDTDHNDLIFHIERKTGGVAELKASQAIQPVESNAYYTAVEIEVWDDMPCEGTSDITYSVSIDNGNNWVEVQRWDSVYEYTLSGTTKTLGSAVTDWSPGSPRFTRRIARIDFSGQDLSGNRLIWKGVLTSQEEACQPRIIDVELTGNVATNGEVSRATPITQTNVLYDGSYETPAVDWTDKSLRGHLRAMRIYDPSNPDQTDNVELWDAGATLTAMNPANRNIYFPSLDVTARNVSLPTGDGTTTTYSGILSNAPILATSVKITDGRETFTDVFVNELRGSLGGRGTINRFTGVYTITFNAPPTNGVAIKGSYSTYTTGTDLKAFTTANVTNAHLALDNTYIHPNGFRYDFDADDKFTESDGNRLVQWVRGYKMQDGTTKREWLLGPIDHSTPALITAPGMSSWYYGTDITTEEREAYDAFRIVNSERQSVVLVGARDGMLHAFDAGNFRWGDNLDTATVKEKRGYFAWSEDTTVKNWWTSYLTNLTATDPPYFGWQGINKGEKAPDYGTGKELWAFIPANLMPRLKNNYLKGEDRAYVDASTAIADVYIDANNDGTKIWKTVALVAEGNGGDSVFCLDVTNPTSPAFMWEYAEPELFRSRSSPAVSALGRIYDVNEDATKWAAFFVSGRNYDSSVYPAVYIIDIETGELLEKVVLDAEGDSDAGNAGGVPSGQPAIIDSNGNGYIDRAYIATDKGYLYKIVLPDNPDSAKGSIEVVHINTDFSYDSDDDGIDDETVPEDQRYHPVYASPSVVVDNGLNSDGTLDYNVRIFFGTGDSPYYDEGIDTDNTKYQFFAYNDKGAPSSTDASEVSLDWFLELPAGHRIFASAFAAAGNIYFGSATGETEDPCEGPNEGRLFGFTYSGQSVINDGDGKVGIEVGDVYTGPMVEDEHLYIKTSKGLQSFGRGTYNNDVTMGGLPFTRVHYWREIF